MFNILHKIFRELFGRESSRSGETRFISIKCEPLAEPKVHFNSVTVTDKTPKNDAVGDKDFIMVVYQGKPLWALFRCPCGCRHVISLSLQKIHRPHWKVRKYSEGRPTVYPSVWQNKDCCSHFWIRDGRVYWCGNADKRVKSSPDRTMRGQSAFGAMKCGMVYLIIDYINFGL